MYPLWVVGNLNPYSYVDNNPFTRIDPLGIWYIDINGSVGYVGGITGGIIISSKGIYPYFGFGVMTPLGVAVTYSPDNPIPAWTAGYQIGYWAGFQVGWSFDEKASSFREFGLVTPGASITIYHIWEPWLWPWIEKEEDKCKK